MSVTVGQKARRSLTLTAEVVSVHETKPVSSSRSE